MFRLRVADITQYNTPWGMIVLPTSGFGGGLSVFVMASSSIPYTCMEIGEEKSRPWTAAPTTRLLQGGHATCSTRRRSASAILNARHKRVSERFLLPNLVISQDERLNDPDRHPVRSSAPTRSRHDAQIVYALVSAIVPIVALPPLRSEARYIIEGRGRRGVIRALMLQGQLRPLVPETPAAGVENLLYRTSLHEENPPVFRPRWPAYQAYSHATTDVVILNAPLTFWPVCRLPVVTAGASPDGLRPWRW